MLKIGLTGGFNSGKSQICSIFKQLGIKVFDLKEEVKFILLENELYLNEYYIALDKAVPPGYEDKKEFLNNFLKSDSTLNLEKVVAFSEEIESKVLLRFHDWINKIEKDYDKKYCLFTSSMIFDHGLNQNFNFNITVSCPINIRLQRISETMMIETGEVNPHVLKNEEIVMKSQFEDKLMNQLADFIIDNSGVTPLWPQVLKIDGQLNV